MHNYQHTVSGAFSRRDLAEGALYQLTRRGLRSEHLQIIAVEETDEEKAEALVSQRAELLRWLRYGIVGTAMGVVCSVLLEVALLLGAPSPLATWLLLGPAMRVDLVLDAQGDQPVAEVRSRQEAPSLAVNRGDVPMPSTCPRAARRQASASGRW